MLVIFLSFLHPSPYLHLGLFSKPLPCLKLGFWSTEVYHGPNFYGYVSPYKLQLRTILERNYHTVAAGFPKEPSATVAGVVIYSICTASVVLARIRNTVINI